MDSTHTKEWWESLPDPFQRVPPPYSFAELVDTFPKALPVVRRATKKRIKDLHKEVNSLSEFREIWSNDINKMHYSKQPGMIAYLDDLISRIEAGYEKEIKKAQYQLDYLANLGKPKKEVRPDAITPERIARARAFPITDLIAVKRGTALCVFHNDHKPSMKVYPDGHVYCFSCSHYADVIDIDMKLSGRTFQESVRHLAP